MLSEIIQSLAQTLEGDDLAVAVEAVVSFYLQTKKIEDNFLDLQEKYFEVLREKQKLEVELLDLKKKVALPKEKATVNVSLSRILGEFPTFISDNGFLMINFIKFVHNSDCIATPGGVKPAFKLVRNVAEEIQSLFKEEKPCYSNQGWKSIELVDKLTALVKSEYPEYEVSFS